MLLKHLTEGGPFFMSLIYLMWIAVILLAIRFLILYNKDKTILKLKRTNDAILFIGSFAFLFGVFAQILGFFPALNAISEAGDISPSLIAGGLMISLLTVMYGFGLLLVSAIIWFIFRNLSRK